LAEIPPSYWAWAAVYPDAAKACALYATDLGQYNVWAAANPVEAATYYGQYQQYVSNPNAWIPAATHVAPVGVESTLTYTPGKATIDTIPEDTEQILKPAPPLASTNPYYQLILKNVTGDFYNSVMNKLKAERRLDVLKKHDSNYYTFQGDFTDSYIIARSLMESGLLTREEFDNLGTNFRHRIDKNLLSKQNEVGRILSLSASEWQREFKKFLNIDTLEDQIRFLVNKKLVSDIWEIANSMSIQADYFHLGLRMPDPQTLEWYHFETQEIIPSFEAYNQTVLAKRKYIKLLEGLNPASNIRAEMRRIFELQGDDIKYLLNAGWKKSGLSLNDFISYFRWNIDENFVLSCGYPEQITLVNASTGDEL